MRSNVNYASWMLAEMLLVSKKGFVDPADDQAHSKMRDGMSSQTGQMMHPDVLYDACMSRADFADWLGEVKDQFERSQFCTRESLSRIEANCKQLGEREVTDLFSHVRRDADRIVGEVTQVLTDLFRFSSLLAYENAAETPAMGKDQAEVHAINNSSGPYECSGTIGAIASNLATLGSAMSHMLPYLEKASSLYEKDLEVYAPAGQHSMQNRHTVFFQRVLQLIEDIKGLEVSCLQLTNQLNATTLKE